MAHSVDMRFDSRVSYLFALIGTVACTAQRQPVEVQPVEVQLGKCGRIGAPLFGGWFVLESASWTQPGLVLTGKLSTRCAGEHLSIAAEHHGDQVNLNVTRREDAVQAKCVCFVPFQVKYPRLLPRDLKVRVYDRGARADEINVNAHEGFSEKRDAAQEY